MTTESVSRLLEILFSSVFYLPAIKANVHIVVSVASDIKGPTAVYTAQAAPDREEKNI